MTRLPSTKAFLDLQVVSLRRRAAAMDGAVKTDDVAAKLAVVAEELGEVELLLGRPTRTNREGAAVLIGLMRRMLDSIEPAGRSGCNEPCRLDVGSAAMPETKRREALTTRIQVLAQQATALHEAFQTEPLKAGATSIIETLREADGWLRGRPSPEAVTLVAKTVEDAARRMYTLVREMD
jgi:hypothetical protein